MTFSDQLMSSLFCHLLSKQNREFFSKFSDQYFIEGENLKVAKLFMKISLRINAQTQSFMFFEEMNPKELGIILLGIKLDLMVNERVGFDQKIYVIIKNIFNF